MQDTSALFGGLGVVVTIFLLVLALLTILMPFMVYAAQKWAYRSYQELTKANTTLKQLLEAMELQRQALLQIVTAEKAGPEA